MNIRRHVFENVDDCAPNGSLATAGLPNQPERFTAHDIEGDTIDSLDLSYTPAEHATIDGKVHVQVVHL